MNNYTASGNEVTFLKSHLGYFVTALVIFQHWCFISHLSFLDLRTVYEIVDTLFYN